MKPCSRCNTALENNQTHCHECGEDQEERRSGCVSQGAGETPDSALVTDQTQMTEPVYGPDAAVLVIVGFLVVGTLGFFLAFGLPGLYVAGGISIALLVMFAMLAG